MRTACTTILALAALLTLASSASALVITVTNPLDDEGRVASTTFSGQNGIEATFAFNPATYDVIQPLSVDSIRYSYVEVTYSVSEAGTRFQLGGNLALWDRETREYRTTFIVNGTDYFNFTTTYGKGSRDGLNVFGPFGWRICTNFEYSKSGISYEMTSDEFAGECENNFWGGSPNQIRHALKFGRIFNGSESQFAILFGDDETRGQAFTLNSDEAIGAPDSVLAKNVTSYIVSTRNFANDASETRFNYFFTTFANHDTATQQSEEGSAQCKKFFGILPCANIDQILGWIFGGIHKVLGFVFGFFPGGEKVASFVTTLLAIVIGVPIHAVALLLISPGRTIVFLHWFFMLIGTVIYATNNTAPASVIIEVPLKIDMAIFRIIKGFALFMYELVIKIGQLIATLIPG